MSISTCGCRVAFILDHELKPYRIPFFVELQKKGFHVTVYHCGELLGFDQAFEQVRVKSKNIGPFEYRTLPCFSDFDFVVHMQNMRVLNLWTMTLNPLRRYNLLHWGIGVSSKRGLRQQNRNVVRVRNMLSYFCSALVLYSDYPKAFIPPNVLKKTFVAPNTVSSPNSTNYSGYEKDCFLFIGALNKRKGLFDLLGAFREFIASGSNARIKRLVIIGNGDQKKFVETYLAENGMEANVHLVGEVQNDVEKQRYFESAVACISPKQAGLSVLESFSYGVPFIAYEDAISGGEHLNIENGVNGFLVQGQRQLVEKMSALDSSEEMARSIGTNAHNFYQNSRSISHMVDGFLDAFDYIAALSDQ
ncbi:Alpha-monoglucosyldiacylglycerol synthase [BD1-7 clade bacterium]|uniref:Alpha-monoglucosyldiacylglycerol synthase n=1 Tax=BD1-7 clade bacterium TaxID=2029982 RepID=A0A5S9QSF8_9GAMM|nr:Alpha-monoglucosyldiacylglycerol synthase [BD1-7 clade bacterium]CAA0121488.1 Alpha-monoglucosyldiacylglycerol synthase [BD1-7 clade bacterium]